MNKIDGLVNIQNDSLLITPKELFKRYSITSDVYDLIEVTRNNIKNILLGRDKRLLVIIGPCSIHDPIAAIEYATKIKILRNKYSDYLEIIMRTYFEKPRTVLGWTGLISDPYLDGSLNVNRGLSTARKLLLHINKLGVPTATEFLDSIVSQFIFDLISWGAIGARTTESQVHRELASYLPCPIGFKNGTDGNILIAIDAIRAAKASHLFLAPNKYGQSSIHHTIGNNCAHMIMRGGKLPNYHKSDIDITVQKLKMFDLPEHLIIDFSHANSFKNYKRQLEVANSIYKQIYNGSTAISGVMIESFLEEGSQSVTNINNLVFGQSITDSCLGWEDSVSILKELSKVVKIRF
ncbi:Phospho-2-dehydro-3-deoxyheptonate aldolase, Trp-sensitive [Buchnera aphidicola (Cinara kochiana kochiana)]|uniref:Phospho-2-dehydro-3-deoxyheptonate aldolase n=1 Tax=Buchnera aphidicola (Cinara kochiana kochiana) TaxID=2518976 RepID=A0A451D5B5_9GAMM|nr:3-deoxy-7-phosphoheptulonate synthase [Buchnera aphidicola]VFP81002.1 Phospho-2-dehydro-3-deoxyheptonate aldolase, Trp-sensitive [Buchnera aphidicola (Cinara kochiana kochiana)]